MILLNSNSVQDALKVKRFLSSQESPCRWLKLPSLASSSSPHSNLEPDSRVFYPSLDLLTLFATTSRQHDRFIVTASQA